jgi:hypothetical protein
MSEIAVKSRVAASLFTSSATERRIFSTAWVPIVEAR